MATTRTAVNHSGNGIQTCTPNIALVSTANKHTDTKRRCYRPAVDPQITSRTNPHGRRAKRVQGSPALSPLVARTAMFENVPGSVPQG